MRETSRVLYADENANRFMLAECQRVANLGGTFSLVHEYSTNWFSIYTITYPED